MVNLIELESLLISFKHVILAKLVLINVITELPVHQQLTALTTHVNVTGIPLTKMVPHGTAMVMDVNVTISPDEINNSMTARLVSVKPKVTMTSTSILMPNLNGSKNIFNGSKVSTQEVSSLNDEFLKSSFFKYIFAQFLA